MFEPHQGTLRLLNEFDNICDFLNMEGERSLKTQREKTPFIAKVIRVGKGQHFGERAIVFLNGARHEYARSYKCCWGHYYNCNRTRIGMYCEALDKFISIWLTVELCSCLR